MLIAAAVRIVAILRRTTQQSWLSADSLVVNSWERQIDEKAALHLQVYVGVRIITLLQGP